MHPFWSEGSYRELTRCMVKLRAQRPPLYWHVAERYLRLRRRRTFGCPECDAATPEGIRHRHLIGAYMRSVERGPIVEEVYHALVNPDKVEAGVAWLAECHDGCPFLPREIYKLVAA